MASGEKPFDEDAARHGGFLYTTGAPLSSRLANRRLSDSTRGVAAATILDIGCGDGTYTAELLEKDPPPQRVVGLDAAAAAIRLACERYPDPRLSFVVGSALKLPYADGSFECAYLRGVLHHLPDPETATKEALRVARRVVVIEPNGYNPVLKIIERTSAYHRDHGEKSYPAWRIRGWVRRAGGQVCSEVFVGLVPMFCPDIMARALKAVEPMIETLPGVRQLSCAVSVTVAERAGSGPGSPP